MHLGCICALRAQFLILLNLAAKLFTFSHLTWGLFTQKTEHHWYFWVNNELLFIVDFIPLQSRFYYFQPWTAQHEGQNVNWVLLKKMAQAWSFI